MVVAAGVVDIDVVVFEPPDVDGIGALAVLADGVLVFKLPNADGDDEGVTLSDVVFNDGVIVEPVLADAAPDTATVVNAEYNFLSVPKHRMTYSVVL